MKKELSPREECVRQVLTEARMGATREAACAVITALYRRGFLKDEPQTAYEIHQAHRDAGRVISAAGVSYLLIHPDDWTLLLEALGQQEVAGDGPDVYVFGHRVVVTSSFGRVSGLQENP